MLPAYYNLYHISCDETWHQMPNFTFFCVMLALAVAMENIERTRVENNSPA
jgi:hypothetical protein